MVHKKRLVCYLIGWLGSLLCFWLLSWDRYSVAGEIFFYFTLFSPFVSFILLFYLFYLSETLQWNRAAVLIIGDIFIIISFILPSLYFFQRSRSEFYAYPLAKDVEVIEPLKDINATPIFVLLSDLHVTIPCGSVGFLLCGELFLQLKFFNVHMVADHLFN